MVIAFTITRINYLVVSLFGDMVLPLSYLYWPAIYICGIKGVLAALFVLFPA